MKKLFVSLFSILFLFSTAAKASSRSRSFFESNVYSNRENSNFSRHSRNHGMNPPPPPPLDEDGNPMPPPDENNGESGFGRQGMNPPPPPPLDEDGNPMPPPDEDESDFKDDE